MNFSLSLFVVVLFVVVILTKAKRTVREDQRLVLFRLGKFFDVREPGLHVLFPFLDEGRLIDLNSAVPEWRRLSKIEVEDRVIAHTAGPLALDEWIKNGRKPK